MIPKSYLFMCLHDSCRIGKVQDLCKPNWNRSVYLKCLLSFNLNKEVEKEKLDPRKLPKIFSLEP